MKLKTLFAASALALASAATANASSITLDFPSAASTQVTSTGFTFFFTDGDFSEEAFTGTGIADLGTLDLAIDLETNILNNGAFVNFDVFVNSVVVGDFTINDGDGDGVFNYSFAVADADPVGDDYTIRFEVTNTVSAGQGSVSFDRSNSFATLTAVAPVPLPASVPLLMAGMGALAYMGRRKKAA